MNSTSIPQTNGDYGTVQAVGEHTAAAILEKSVQSLRNERHLGRGLPYVKIGRSVRYLLSDIREYLQRHRIDPEGRHAA